MYTERTQTLAATYAQCTLGNRPVERRSAIRRVRSVYIGRADCVRSVYMTLGFCVRSVYIRCAQIGLWSGIAHLPSHKSCLELRYKSFGEPLRCNTRNENNRCCQ